MKKIFTLVFALGTISSVFAQSKHDESKNVIFGHTDYNKVYSTTDQHTAFSFDKKEKDRQITQINKDFDRQIKMVNRNRSLRSFEKQRQIRKLEAQRAQKIKEVNDRFDHRKRW
jgi:hypothetical protein